jgi:hypothetical protein
MIIRRFIVLSIGYSICSVSYVFAIGAGKPSVNHLSDSNAKSFIGLQRQEWKAFPDFRRDDTDRVLLNPRDMHLNFSASRLFTL